MPAVLNTNVASLWASKNLLISQEKMANSVERLSSGLRINRAKDDAAGLGVSNSLTKQINSANQGIRNLNDGISMVQTAEGAIAAASEMGQRILTLATQGANGTMGTTDRTAIKNEMSQLLSAINSIGNRTKFSGNSLLGVNPLADAVSNQLSLQVSNVTTDVIALSSNAFKSIGGFSSSASMPSATKTATAGTSGGDEITLSSVASLENNMLVTGTGIPDGTTIKSIDTANRVVTLTAKLTAAASTTAASSASTGSASASSGDAASSSSSFASS